MPSIALASLGALLAMGIVVKPAWFKVLSVLIGLYSLSVLLLTA
ncbi:hypothetical protein NOR53_3669 [gamma proteobacterium NOR5-3]|nr:hypothetical protein NOR53_3669 [gamma proteobacterium NOR5-3]